MSEFEHEQWFKSLSANGKTVYFLGNEHKVSKMAWDYQQSKIEQLEREVAKLKDKLGTHKIEHYEMYGRISYAYHSFMTMSRDCFYKNIEAIIRGKLRHHDFSFDKTRIKALRGEHD